MLVQKRSSQEKTTPRWRALRASCPAGARAGYGVFRRHIHVPAKNWLASCEPSCGLSSAHPPRHKGPGQSGALPARTRTQPLRDCGSIKINCLRPLYRAPLPRELRDCRVNAWIRPVREADRLEGLSCVMLWKRHQIVCYWIEDQLRQAFHDRFTHFPPRLRVNRRLSKACRLRLCGRPLRVAIPEAVGSAM